MAFLKLKNRVFDISKAYIQGEFKDGDLHCYIEIETVDKMIDEELWEPCLRHQGFIFKNVSTWPDLKNRVISWKDSNDVSYKHPEIGLLYVFSHTETKNNSLEFSDVTNDTIEISWKGVADVYWDEDFDTDVPFEVQTKLSIIVE
ncbi:hypothetical protein ACOSP6_09290 [Tenacibaculum sp. MEBiC06402]|uniref:hypothetical protein n=1 Tax=unclassified Tenacibaculum TaxID=2635139 RepID=UPI003B9D20AE